MLKRSFYSILFILILSSVKAQVPTGTPTQIFSGPWYQFKGFIETQSGVMNAIRDTNFIPKQMGVVVIRPQDSLLYLWNGKIWSLIKGSSTNGGIIIDVYGYQFTNDSTYSNVLLKGIRPYPDYLGIGIMKWKTQFDTISTGGIVLKQWRVDDSSFFRIFLPGGGGSGSGGGDNQNLQQVTQFGNTTDRGISLTGGSGGLPSSGTSMWMGYLGSNAIIASFDWGSSTQTPLAIYGSPILINTNGFINMAANHGLTIAAGGSGDGLFTLSNSNSTGLFSVRTSSPYSSFLKSDSSAYSRVKGASAIEAEDFVTKAQLDSAVGGLPRTYVNTITTTSASSTTLLNVPLTNNALNRIRFSIVGRNPSNGDGYAWEVVYVYNVSDGSISSFGAISPWSEGAVSSPGMSTTSVVANTSGLSINFNVNPPSASTLQWKGYAENITTQ